MQYNSECELRTAWEQLSASEQEGQCDAFRAEALRLIHRCIRPTAVGYTKPKFCYRALISALNQLSYWGLRWESVAAKGVETHISEAYRRYPSVALLEDALQEARHADVY